MLTLADVMTRRPVMAPADATVADALEATKDRGISSTLVLPRPGSMEYGIVTTRDIVTKVVKLDLDAGSIQLKDIMTWRLITAQPGWTLQQGAALMARARIRRLPVVEGLEIVGLVSDTDLLIALAPREDWDHIRLVRKARMQHRAESVGPADTVADLMSRPVLTIAPGATVRQAVEKLVGTGVSSLLVTHDRAGTEGIITKRDIVTKVVAQGRDPTAVPVLAAMNRPVRVIEGNVSLEECSARMEAEGVRRFPVSENGQIIGIISDSDILAAVESRRWKGERKTMPTSYIVADVMRVPDVELQPVWAEAVSPEHSLWEAAARLKQAGVRQLPVVQEGRVIGVVTDTDIVRALEERGGGD